MHHCAGLEPAVTLCQSATKSGQAALGVRAVFGPRRHQHTLRTAFDEVAPHQVATSLIVDANGRQVPDGGALQQDEGHVGGLHAGDVVAVDGGFEQQQPVDSALAQQADARMKFTVITMRKCRDEMVAAGPRSLVDSGQQTGVKTAFNLRKDETDDVVLASGETARRSAGKVTPLVSDTLNPKARFLADVGMAVQSARDGGRGDAGKFGNGGQ